MAPGTYSLHISSSSAVKHPKPHTVYNITLTLPIQTFTIQKRYSEFLDLHSKLTSQTGRDPPVSPPPKTYLPSFLGGNGTSPALVENRRRRLEEYLQGIAECKDSRWRDTSAWRTFLNLPSGISTKSSNATSLRTNGSYGSTPTDAALASDPALWLDTHREVKTLLQEARKRVSARSSADTPAAGHEEGAEAKKLLIRVAGIISALDRGLKSAGDEWGREKLGDGEMRRRRDLVSQANKEKDDLESLLSKMGRKQDVESVVESLTSTSTHVGSPPPGSFKGSGIAARASKGRVLGKETAKTRELDNTGVLQLQQQMMREQDEDIDLLTAAVRRQRELATQINEELEVQNELLGLVEEDVDRVHGKINVARKRVDKIS